MLIRLAEGRTPQPSAVILDARTAQSTAERGAGAGYPATDGARTQDHLVVDTLELLLTVHVTAANEQERAQVATLTQAVQAITGQTVEVAFVDHGYTGKRAATAAAEQGIQLEVVRLSEANRGFVLLPRRWVVEIVFPQMTKLYVFARRGGGNDIVNLHLRIRHDDSVNEQHDQLPSLFKRGRRQAGANGLTKGID